MSRKYPADPQSLLWKAAAKGDAKGLARAVGLGADIDLPDGEGLRVAGWLAAKGCPDALAAALSLGADPRRPAPGQANAWEICAMAIVDGPGKASEAKAACLDMLLAAGADPFGEEFASDDALTMAVHWGEIACLRLLAEHASKSGPKGMNALSRGVHLATSRSKHAALGALLAAGGDPNARQLEGWSSPGRVGHSCLQVAILHSCLVSLEALLARGADARSPMAFGEPYYPASTKECPDALAAARLFRRTECEEMISRHLDRLDVEEAAGPATGSAPSPRI